MGVVTNITTGPVPVPGEKDAWVDFRKVSWLTLDKAEKAKMKELAVELRDIGAALREMDTVQATAARAEAKRDRLGRYDKLTLLQHGIAAWSYPGDVAAEALDGPTADWAARQILAFALPEEADLKEPASPPIGS